LIHDANDVILSHFILFALVGTCCKPLLSDIIVFFYSASVIKILRVKS